MPAEDVAEQKALIARLEVEIWYAARIRTDDAFYTTRQELCLAQMRRKHAYLQSEIATLKELALDQVGPFALSSASPGSDGLVTLRGGVCSNPDSNVAETGAESLIVAL